MRQAFKTRVMDRMTEDLITKVLGKAYQVDYKTSAQLLDSVVAIHNYDNGRTTINIYEFERNCKQWAYDMGFQIRSSYKSLVFEGEPFAEIITEFGPEQYTIVTNLGEDTEIETILACTQWIIDFFENPEKVRPV